MTLKVRGPVTDEEKLGAAHWYIDNPGSDNDGLPVNAVVVIGADTAQPVSSANGTPTGAVSIDNGADATQGAVADAAWGLSGDATEVAILKKMALLLNDMDGVQDKFTTFGDLTNDNDTIELDMSQNAGLVYALQVVAVGTVSAFVVALEGSIDGVTYGTAHPVITYSSASLSLGDVASATAKPLLKARIRLVSHTYGTATKLTAHLLALR